MQSQPITSYIWLGLHWRYLQDAKAGFIIHGDGRALFNISAVLQRLEQFGLQVTSRAAFDLISFRDELEVMPNDAVLSTSDAERLTSIMATLQNTLQAEGSGKVAYIVTDKRLDVDKLLGQPSKLFSPKVYDQLPEISRHDFREAGYCIAFERPTAAAFHLLRGTEGVLRSFYCSIVKRSRVSPLLWGPMTDHLRKRRDAPPSELLRNLDNIRLSFRNPTQHPEKIYDIQEAQDLFGICVDVINRMVNSKFWQDAT